MEALQRLHNRGSISTGYNIDNSLKFETDNSEYMYFDGSSITDYERTTFSVWVKRTELGKAHYIAEFGNGTANTTNVRIFFDTDDTLRIYGNSIIYRITNRVFRDTSAWYHLFFKFDTTQGTSNDRVRLWVNGVQETSFSTINNPGAGTGMGFNRNLRNTLGAGSEDGPRGFFAGYIAQAWNSGGTPPDVTDFGEFDSDTGIWKPIDISELSIPDSNGFYLDFSDSADLGNDLSSNNNDFTLSNITSVDQATDTPTNNFVTWIGDGTPWNATAGDNSYTKDGATTVYHGATTGWSTIPTTQGVYGGKWYAELKWDSTKPNLMWGVLPVSRMGELPLNTYLGATDAHDGFGFYTDSTRVRYYEGTVVSPPQNLGLANGDIIQIAMDKDNGYVYFGINNTWTQDVNSVTGVPTSGSSGTGGWAMNYDDAYCFAASLYNPSASFPVNFGGYTAMTISSSASDANGYGNFEYAPPTGYYALCTKNLAQYGG